jgi:hypothetical protein
MNDSLKKFIDGLPREHRKSNIYHVICQDKNGNITDEKFGINVYTNYGFDLDIRHQNTASMDTNNSGLFVGNGSGTPSPTDLKLFSDIKSGAKENRLPGFFCYMTSSSGGDGSGYKVTDDVHNTYDAETNMLIGRRLCEEVTLAYNYSWWSEDIVITEFGEGFWGGYHSNYWDPTQHAYALTTHCLVYDENYQPSSFTKHLDEQITITLYRTACIKCDLFDALWNQGKYLFTNPGYMVHGLHQDHGHSAQGYSWWGNTWHPVFELSICSGRCLNAKDFPLYPVGLPNNNGTNYYNWGENLDKGFGNDSRSWLVYANMDKTRWNAGYAGRTFNTQHPNGWRCNMNWGNSCVSTNNSSNPIENSDKNNGKYGLTIFTSDSMTQNGLRTLSQNFWYFYNNMETPEELVHYYAYTDDFMTPNFRNIFGLGAVVANNDKHQQLQIPVNDFHITSLKQYNYLTDDWDIDEQFVDDPTFDFRNPECALCGQMTLNEFKEGKGFSVYLNTNPAAITAFTNPDTEEIYMTDSYWDSSSYVLVEDHSDVPVALQHKRYIIKYPQQSSWKGIYPVREHSNHALVPSTPIEELNATIPLYDYDNENSSYNTKLIYSSDDGWIYCDGTLIYPESDDGTGHPYTYTLSKMRGGDGDYTDGQTYAHGRNSMGFMYYTKHSIVAVAGYAYIWNWYTNTAVDIVTIFHPDPEHPEINPETTKVVYGPDAFFRPWGLVRAQDNYIDLQSTYIYDQFAFNFDENNDRFYISRGNQIAMIDTTATTIGMEFLPLNETSNNIAKGTAWFGLVYNTDMIITYYDYSYDTTIKKDKVTFMLYDVVTKQPVSTFDLPVETDLTLHLFFGYNNLIYIQGYKDSKYYLFIHNYMTNSWQAKPNVLLNFLYSYGSAKYSRVVNQIYWDSDVFVASVFARMNSNKDGDTGCRTFIIFADEPLNPIYFETPSDNPWSNSFSKGYQHDMPRVKKLNGGKHYVMLFNGRLATTTSGDDGVNHSAAYIIDLGYIKNKGLKTINQLRSEMPVPAFRMPNKCYGLGGATITSGSGMQYISDYVYDANNLWFAETCFYKDKVFVVTTFGKPKFIPVEMFLPHKMTGTTRTHQAYNKRKRYSLTSHGMVLNNSANVDNS